jgi:diguanylate cyclase (GGDEF)-like protein
LGIHPLIRFYQSVCILCHGAIMAMASTRLTRETDVWRHSAGLALVSAVLSVAITSLAMWWLMGHDNTRVATFEEMWRNGLVVAVIVPLVVAPIVTWRLLNTMRELNVAQNELQRLARTDPLTGLLNRRGFMEDIATAIARARADRAPIAIILFDIDHFKSINDRFGHETGDVAIRYVASVLAGVSAPLAASLCRHGGEEFALLLTGSTIRQVHALAETARIAVMGQPFLAKGVSLQITVSAGCAIALCDDASLDGLLASADAALYRAKAAGRNRVEAQAA